MARILCAASCSSSARVRLFFAFQAFCALLAAEMAAATSASGVSAISPILSSVAGSPTSSSDAAPLLRNSPPMKTLRLSRDNSLSADIPGPPRSISCRCWLCRECPHLLCRLAERRARDRQRLLVMGRREQRAAPGAGLGHHALVPERHMHFRPDVLPRQLHAFGIVARRAVR